MTDLRNALWAEMKKALRSKMPLSTVIIFLLLPLIFALVMIIYKDPEFARRVGIISMKAELIGGSADWPFYMSMLSQAIAAGGLILFSFIHVWVFGREFADGTLKDILAIPVSRPTILIAKFIVVMLWSIFLTVMLLVAALVLGALVGLSQFSMDVVVDGSITMLIAACLVMLVVTPISFFASIGRGYLLPMGFAALLMIFTQVASFLGWGHIFPWAIPTIYVGADGSAGGLDLISYIIVVATGLIGVAGTIFWWQTADHNR